MTARQTGVLNGHPDGYPFASEEDRPVPIGDSAAVVAHPGSRLSTQRASRACANDFTSERMLRPEVEAPHSGWRRLLYEMTGGLVNLGPSAADIERRELIGRVKAPVHDCRRIAVLSRKGGVGKTTTTLMLGHTFASHRGDRVIALDGNPDAGSLGYRVQQMRSVGGGSRAFMAPYRPQELLTEVELPSSSFALWAT